MFCWINPHRTSLPYHLNLALLHAIKYTVEVSSKIRLETFPSITSCHGGVDASQYKSTLNIRTIRKTNGPFCSVITEGWKQNKPGVLRNFTGTLRQLSRCVYKIPLMNSYRLFWFCFGSHLDAYAVFVRESIPRNNFLTNRILKNLWIKERRYSKTRIKEHVWRFQADFVLIDLVLMHRLPTDEINVQAQHFN